MFKTVNSKCELLSIQYRIIKDNVIAQVVLNGYYRVQQSSIFETFKIVLHSSSSSSSSSGLHLKMIQYHKYMPYHNKPDKIKYKSSKFDQKKSQI
ncbi:hypothetical protein T09_3379 [Trichinella sp. T9]|nr:hypothetical protein T09_3379 [Trichinella sp. T9]